MDVEGHRIKGCYDSTEVSSTRYYVPRTMYLVRTYTQYKQGASLVQERTKERTAGHSMWYLILVREVPCTYHIPYFKGVGMDMAMGAAGQTTAKCYVVGHKMNGDMPGHVRAAARSNLSWNLTTRSLVFPLDVGESSVHSNQKNASLHQDLYFFRPKCGIQV